MARYFKFHTVADIEAEVERLGLSLRFRDDFTPLFHPVRIGDLDRRQRPLRPADGRLRRHARRSASTN